MEGDIEQAVYAGMKEGNDDVYSHIASDSSTKDHDGIEFSENAAYGSQACLLAAATGGPEATEQTSNDKEDNPYVSDPMGQKEGKDQNLVGTETYYSIADDTNNDIDEELYDTINDSPEGADSDHVEVQVDENVAYNTNSHGSEQEYYSEPAAEAIKYSSGDSHPLSDRNDLFPTGKNIAYKSIPSSNMRADEDYDTALVGNGAYNAKTTRNGITLAGNAAYTAHTTQNTGHGQGQSDTYSTGILERERLQASVRLSSNVAYIKHEDRESNERNSTSPTHDPESVAGQEEIAVGDNAAYVPHTNARDEATIADNAAYVTSGVTVGEEISVGENVAYLTHDNGETARAKEEYSAAYINRQPSQQSGEVSVRDNIAYLQHAKKDGRNTSNSSRKKPAKMQKPAIAAKRKAARNGYVKNGAITVTSNGGSNTIEVADNVAYLTHESRPTALGSRTDTTNNHLHNGTTPATQKQIPIAENIAYETILQGDELADNEAYLSSQALVSNGGGTIGLQGNVAYDTHNALPTVGEVEPQEEGDYVIN